VPTYAYACTVCEHRFEAHQAFTDSSLTVCPECAGRLRKIFPTVGVVFKGSGFYRNDSRSAGKVPVGATSSQGESHGEGSSSGSGDSATTGAAAKPGTPADAGTASSGSGKAAGAAAATTSGTNKSSGSNPSSGSGKAPGPVRSGSSKVGASSGSPAAG
jgi:putative FmdB family regulatory protein